MSNEERIAAPRCGTSERADITRKLAKAAPRLMFSRVLVAQFESRWGRRILNDLGDARALGAA